MAGDSGALIEGLLSFLNWIRPVPGRRLGIRAGPSAGGGDPERPADAPGEPALAERRTLVRGDAIAGPIRPGGSGSVAGRHRGAPFASGGRRRAEPVRTRRADARSLGSTRTWPASGTRTRSVCVSFASVGARQRQLGRIMAGHVAWRPSLNGSARLGKRIRGNPPREFESRAAPIALAARKVQIPCPAAVVAQSRRGSNRRA
jgi:hypothetical protein